MTKKIKVTREEVNALKNIKNINDMKDNDLSRVQLNIKQELKGLSDGKKNEIEQKKELARQTKIEENNQIARGSWQRFGEWWDENRRVQAQAYVELGTAYIELMAGYVLLFEAIAYEEGSGLTWLWRETVGETIAGQVIAAVAHEIANLPSNAYDKVLRSVGLRKNAAHEIRYSIDIDNNSHQIMTTVTKDGEPLSKEEKQLFDAGFVAWLESRGYVFSEGDQLLKKGNDPLTNEKLKEISVDNEHGLGAFFNSNMGLDVKETPRPVF